MASEEVENLSILRTDSNQATGTGSNSTTMDKVMLFVSIVIQDLRLRVRMGLSICMSI